MADNVTLDAGSGGAVIAGDDIGGVIYPRSKVTIGSDGNNDGDVSASNPMPVKGTGSAGTANAGVVTVQGIASMTAVQVADNAGSLTVDAPSATPVFVRLSDGSDPVDTVPISLDGMTTTLFAKQEDTASVSGHLGACVLAVRKDTPANASDADGDYEFVQMSGGRVWVSATIDSSLPAGTSAIGKLVGNNGVDIGDVTINNASGASSVNIQDGGNTITVDAGSAAPVFVRLSDGADPVDTIPISLNGMVTTLFAKQEDTASASGHLGVSILAIRKGTPADLSDTDGDYEMLQISGGRLYVTATIDAALPAGTNAIGKLAANSGVDIGDVDITSIAAGANTIGNVGLVPRTSGGLTIYRNLDVDETEDEIKGSAGQVYWIHAMNMSNVPVYLKFWNATAANVTVGSTTPVLTIPLATQGDTNGAGTQISIPQGLVFDTAITVGATTGVLDSSSAGPGTNEIIINMGYA